MKQFTLQHLTRAPLRLSSGPAPLLLLLHGIGSNEQDLMSLSDELDPRFFIVSARAPLTLQLGAYAWYQITFTPEGYGMDFAEGSAGLEALLRFVDEAIAAYPVDANRIFLMGFSQGSIMSLAAILAAPRKFAGVAGMSGRLVTEIVPKIADASDLQDFPMMIVHGISDTVIELKYGRAIRDYFLQMPVKLTYKEYAMAHQVSRESLNDIRHWLSNQLDHAATIEA